MITVAQYIAWLQTLPQDLPVLVTDCPFTNEKQRTRCSNFRPAKMPHALRVVEVHQDGRQIFEVQVSGDRNQDGKPQIDAVRLA